VIYWSWNFLQFLSAPLALSIISWRRLPRQLHRSPPLRRTCALRTFYFNASSHPRKLNSFHVNFNCRKLLAGSLMQLVAIGTIVYVHTCSHHFRTKLRVEETASRYGG
jgi:hypothetical protein